MVRTDINRGVNNNGPDGIWVKALRLLGKRGVTYTAEGNKQQKLFTHKFFAMNYEPSTMNQKSIPQLFYC